MEIIGSRYFLENLFMGVCKTHDDVSFVLMPLVARVVLGSTILLSLPSGSATRDLGLRTVTG